MKNVSVVIPARNAGIYLGEALESSLSQEGIDALDVIVINDNSTDDTEKIANSFGSSVRVLKNIGRGIANARNTGIAAARHELVAFLDADDRMLQRRLDLQATAMLRSPNNVLCCSLIKFIDQTGKSDQENAPWNSCKPHDFTPNCLHVLFRANFVATSTVMVRRSKTLHLGGFDKGMAYCEDYELWLRLAATGDFTFIDEKLVEYRLHPQQISRRSAEMSEGKLLARKKLLDADPEAAERLGTPYINSIIQMRSLELAHELSLSGNHAAALKIYHHGLQIFPTSFYLWKSWLACLARKISKLPPHNSNQPTEQHKK